MIVWSGFGWVVPIIAFACVLLGNTIIGETWSENTWGQAIALLVAAVLTFAFDRFFLAKRADKTLMNKETGEDVIIRKNDSLFFIPVRFWPIVLVAIAVAIKVLA
ncbi:MAG: hypothetical protein COA43_09855 [Robiginitomaculum sp.]|nr:MAG: hypothetical protein COA43_09855 [Robiginitomaculum sp.]